MSEASGTATVACMRYHVKAFATPESAEHWLEEMTNQDYHFVSMTSLATTNHFSKELEGLVWVVVEHDESRSPG